MSEDTAQTIPVLETLDLDVRIRGKTILQGVSMRVAREQIFGIIGPSGAGKSTLLRCFNRLSEISPGIEIRGDVRFNGNSVYTVGANVNALRSRIGMLFQEPVVFPTDIRGNVLSAARRLRRLSKVNEDDLVEASLRDVALWEEVRDRLSQNAANLSVGQQQRLCLARTLAVQPEVLLMDEPTSALDPKSARAIEELMLHLKARHTIVIVTHNILQASRLCDVVACVSVKNEVGQIVEQGACATLFRSPQTPELREYLRWDGLA
jgi:phosphate transport system ATP-binding protein